MAQVEANKQTNENVSGEEVEANGSEQQNANSVARRTEEASAKSEPSRAEPEDMAARYERWMDGWEAAASMANKCGAQQQLYGDARRLQVDHGAISALTAGVSRLASQLATLRMPAHLSFERHRCRIGTRSDTVRGGSLAEKERKCKQCRATDR